MDLDSIQTIGMISLRMDYRNNGLASGASSIPGTKGSSKASSIPCSISSSKDSEQVGVQGSTQVGIQSSTQKMLTFANLDWRSVANKTMLTGNCRRGRCWYRLSSPASMLRNVNPTPGQLYAYKKSRPTGTTSI